MNSKSFRIFCEQKELFTKALSNYDSNIWFPPPRGNIKVDNPSNWFVSFVPSSWGIWKGAIYGVHFDFMYARPKKELPERFRLAVGVETPLKSELFQPFKEKVLSSAKRRNVSESKFKLQAKNRTKLLEADYIPFNKDSWKIALERYISLEPAIDAIGEVVKTYYQKGAFNIRMEFPS